MGAIGRVRRRVLAALMASLVAPVALAQPDYTRVEFREVPVARGLVMLRGAGRNLGVSFGAPVPPAPASALPVVTFGDGLTVHLNGETIEVRHVAPAHTDGDAVVYFWNANAVHTGDLFWNGMYPLVDATSGGSLAGMIAGVESVLARINGQTRVIPGHGPLGDKAALSAYLEMLRTAAARISALREQDRTVEEIVAARPTADPDARWGGGLFDGAKWVGMVAAAP